jgi:cytochrome c biogenesis protein CcmG, thiol:disulfide interchange protein DsbE
MIWGNRLYTILPVVVFAALAVSLSLSLTHDPKVIPSMLQDRPLPNFELPPLISNQSSLRSDEISARGFTIINVFSSWCGGCRNEHPMLLQLAKDKRFTLIGLNWKDDPENARKFLETYGNPFVKVGADILGRTGIDLGVSGVPETFLIDTHGRVRLRIPGPLSPEIWKNEFEHLLSPEEPTS